MPVYQFNQPLEPVFIGADVYDETMKALATDIAENAQEPDAYPHYDIFHMKDKKTYALVVNVPGYSKSEVEITLDGNKLEVVGTKKKDFNDDANVYHGNDFPENFTRSWRIMNTLRLSEIHLKEGVLVIEFEDTTPLPAKKTVYPVGYPKSKAVEWKDPTPPIVNKEEVGDEESKEEGEEVVTQPTAPKEPVNTPEEAVKAVNEVVTPKAPPIPDPASSQQQKKKK
jgi:HSP20 family molecular chaperone IbpA